MKYGKRKITVDGVAFDSKLEAARWHELTMLLRAGLISDLQRQVSLKLCDGVKLSGDTSAKRPLVLKVDFRYFDIARNALIYEDAKGFETPGSRIKRHVAKAIHGIDVELYQKRGR